MAYLADRQSDLVEHVLRHGSSKWNPKPGPQRDMIESEPYVRMMEYGGHRYGGGLVDNMVQSAMSDWRRANPSISTVWRQMEAYCRGDVELTHHNCRCLVPLATEPEGLLIL